MSKIVQRVIFICTFLVCAILTLYWPWVLGDTNQFLRDFVGSQLLGFLGIVVTITLASIANLNLELNKYEEKLGRPAFPQTRSSVRVSAYAMVIFLGIAVVLVTMKPLFCLDNTTTSIFNSAALLVVLFNLLIMADIVKATLALTPIHKPPAQSLQRIKPRKQPK